MSKESSVIIVIFFFFFQAEDGIRDLTVTGVQTCALPISVVRGHPREAAPVDMELLTLELHVPVDPVEGEQREHRRMRAPHPAHRRRELAPEAARDRATVPLVEVAEEHARPDEPCGVADEPAEQL